MFKFNEAEQSIKMNEGDFGVILTFCFDDIEGTDIKFKIYEISDKSSIIEKTFKSSDIVDNKIDLELTQEESNKLEKKSYYWGLYQYVENKLKNTLIVNKIFQVEEGA